MGANDCCGTFEAKNEIEALKRAEELMAEMRHDEGSGAYAGHLGICDGVKVHRAGRLLTENQAYNLAFEDRPKALAEKWGPAILFQVKNVGGSRKRKWFLAGLCAS